MRQAAQRIAAIARRVLRESDDLEQAGRPPLFLNQDERAQFEADIAKLLGQQEPLSGAQDFDSA
jgi:hypothetical protein